jgi:hypothetical protein
MSQNPIFRIDAWISMETEGDGGSSSGRQRNCAMKRKCISLAAGFRTGIGWALIGCLVLGASAWKILLARAIPASFRMQTGQSAVTHPLPDTGQFSTFTTTFGEDADYTINPPSFADNGDGTVTDNITGLMWQKADGGEMTWENASAYAQGLNLGGWNDWRLPTNHELFSVLNHSGNPALDPAVFTMSNAEYWWTGDTMAGDASRVWVANAGGGTGPHPKNETISAGGSKRYHVRCVRGGISSTRPKPVFRDNGDGTISDLDTGLIWQQAEVSAAISWEAALNYAENLSLAGYGDWRLPNIKELQSLNDETITNPSIDRNYFAGAAASRYWSSTTLAKQAPRAWYGDFQSGIASYEDKTSSMRVRCVRGGIAGKVQEDGAFLATELLGRPTDTSITISAVPARSMDVYFEYGTAAGQYASRTQTVSYAAGTPIAAVLDPLQPDREHYYRIRYRETGAAEFAAGEEHVFHTQRSRGSTFTIAIQADPHMDENTDPDTYRLTMQNMLADKPDFMVDLGDTFMSDKLSSPTYARVMDRALLLRSYYNMACHSVPLFLALGNHEGEWGSRLTSSANNLPVWDTIIRKLYYLNPFPDDFYAGDSAIQKYVGLRQSYYAWEWGDALFVVLDPYWNTPQTPELSDNWSLTLGRNQYEWLKQTLESSQAAFKFVFCHNLVGGWNKNNTGQMRGGVEAAKYLEWGGYNPDDTWGFDKARPGWAKPIHQLLVENHVTIFFHGHDHFYGQQALDGLVYQEVPQPGARNTELGTRAASYGYTEGVLLGGAGYLRIRVSPSNVTMEYVQTWIPANETISRKNGMVAASYSVAAKVRSSVDLNLAAGGSTSAVTAGAADTTQTGYMTAAVKSGDTPYGIAVFRYIQDGIVVSEAAVPSSPPTRSARLFVDYGPHVAAGPAHLATGTVNTNTGFAIVNPADATAHVTYTLRDLLGQTLATGHGALDAGSQHALFIDQLQELLASDFSFGPSYLEAMRYGTLQIDSDQTLSILALRMTRNQKVHILYTSLPIADLQRPSEASALYFPQVADGGGYTTSLILLNSTDKTQTGMLQFYANNGTPMAVGSADGGTGSVFAYSIPSAGCHLFVTDGSPADICQGSAHLVPDAGSGTPEGAGIFRWTSNGYLASETGAAFAAATTHARIIVDMSEGHDSGLALSAAGAAPISIVLTAYQKDGVTPAGNQSATVDLPGNGHLAAFPWQWISGLPADFRGILDVFSVSPFAALTLRTLTNEGGDYLLTTFPVANMVRTAPAPLVFPHLADGGGFRTEFIFLSSGTEARVEANFFGGNGAPLAIAK